MKRRAYSLVFAFVIMTLIMIIASASIQNVRNKLIRFNQIEAAAQARLAAESATELAILAIKDQPPGYELESEEAFCLDPDSDNTCNVSGDYTVVAQGQEHDDIGPGSTFIPVPGTGNAAPSDQCSLLSPQEDINHPCNWNLFRVGESVTIPLMVYDENAADDQISLPTLDSGFTSFSLKLRTPCQNGSYDEACNNNDGTTSDDVRYEFEGVGSNPIGNPSLVLWQLIGEDDSGSQFALIANDSASGSTPNKRRELDNSELYESLINDGTTNGDHIVLESTNFTEIQDFITDQDSNGITSLVLQLDLVSALENSNGSIPYLEWQLEIDSAGLPTSDNKASIYGEGLVNIGGVSYYFIHEVFKPLFGENVNIYTLSN